MGSLRYVYISRIAVFLCLIVALESPADDAAPKKCPGFFGRLGKNIGGLVTGVFDTVKLRTGGAVGELDAEDYQLFRRVMGERHKGLSDVLTPAEIAALKAKGSWDQIRSAFKEGHEALELDREDLALLRRALAATERPLDQVLNEHELEKLRQKGTFDKFKAIVENDGDLALLDKEDQALLRKVTRDKFRPLSEILTPEEMTALREKGSLGDFRRAFSKSKAVHELDPEDEALLFKVVENAQRRLEDLLTPAEIERLKEKKIYDRFERARKMNLFFRTLNLARGALMRVKTPTPTKEGFVGKALDLWHTVLHLLPYGFPNVRQMRANFIFWKVAMNHEYKLSDRETNFLKAFPKLEKKLEDYRKEVAVSPLRYKALSTWHNAKDAAMRILGATVALAVGADVLTTQYLNTGDSLDPTHPDGLREDELKTEIIFVYPMWGPAVRVGNTVYFYGPRGVRKLTIAQFREMLKAASDKNSNFFMSNHHTRIELKLNGDERAELMRIVEEDLKRGGSPVGFLNRNSIRRINTAVAQVTNMQQPPLINRTRYLSTVMYRLSGLFGQEKVGKIVYAHDDKHVLIAKGKDFTLDVMESLGFLRGNKAMNFVTGELRDEAIEALIETVTNPNKNAPDGPPVIPPAGDIPREEP